MKVLYELDLNDIIRIVAEKYGVPQEKVKKSNKDGLNYLMIDMSETETPAPTVKLEAPKIYDEDIFKAAREAADEKKYEQINDELLENYIKQGKTIPEIVKLFGLEDDRKYSARLYKRAEKFRSEGARLGRKRNKEKAEDTEPTAG